MFAIAHLDACFARASYHNVMCNMNIEQDSILSYTDQAWKYHTGLLMGSLSIIVFIAAFIFFSYSQWQFEYFVYSAGAGAFASSIIEFTIRCPKCKSRWYLEALKKPVGSGNIIMVRTQKACPVCGLSSDKATQQVI